MNDDALLLRRYAEEGSETAFTELVHRHVGLVYGAALRRTGGDAHRAADVAQQVFTTLAREARQLSGHTVLSAWLHTATRNLAINLMMSEQRRKARELAAVALETVAAPSPADAEWAQIRPVLDAAIDELPEPDRVAVVLRFLELRAFAEIGAVLQISADAARMRTERAIEKLRTTLARRGITSTASALGTLVSTHAAVTAPLGLANSLASAALGGMGTAAGTGSLAVALFMNLKTIASLTAVVAALGLGYYVGYNRAASEPLPPPPETPQHLQTIAALRQENLKLRAETDRLTAANAALTQAAQRAAATPRVTSAPEPDKAAMTALVRSSQHKAMLNNLRMIAAASDQFLLENGRIPTSLDELVGPTKYIRQLNPVEGESYGGLVLNPRQPLTVTTPEGVSVTFDPTGKTTTGPTADERQAVADLNQAIEQRFGPDIMQRMQAAVKKALEAYRAAHDDKTPPTMEAVLPYFATPQEGADFLEFTEFAKSKGAKL